MSSKKFGSFSGVFVPSFEAILGTVLFLLLPLLTANVGLLWILLIIVLAHTVTLSTTSSLSDCVTNLSVIGGGGLYAICKESLGKALGGSIGFSLFLAQVASVGFYIIGFTEVLHPILAPYIEPLISHYFGAEIIVYARQILASLFLLLFCAIVLVGVDFVVKLQNLIFIILCLSVTAIFLAPFTGLTFQGKPVFVQSFNIFGSTPMTFSLFFVVFTQFFPAVTGISAGVGMSGDLKNPQRSIVRGTFLAIFVTFIIYVGVSLVFSRIDVNVILQSSIHDQIMGRALVDLFGLGAALPQGLLAALVFVGILFATASSALSLFVAGPRTLQSMIWDKLLPKGLRILSRDFFKRKSEPRYAIILTFFMSLTIIWSGDLSFAASLVGILFLLVYAWVNGAAFLERVSMNPTFRPSFKGHWAISLYGLISSLAVISLFQWQLGLALIFSQFVIFRLLLKYKMGGAIEGVWWGILFNLSNFINKKLRKMSQSHKNWRPIVQVISLETNENTWRLTAEIAKRICFFSGETDFYLIRKEEYEDKALVLDEDLDILDINTLYYKKKPAEVALNIMNYCQSFLKLNTTLIEYHKDLDHVSMLRKSMELGRSTILFRPAARYDLNIETQMEHKTIDVWWLNEENGNFMLILSFIINQYREVHRKDMLPVRILRVLREGDDEQEIRMFLEAHLKKSRLNGMIEILANEDGKRFSQYLSEYSYSASYVFTGLPGRYIEKENPSFFNFLIDEYFFDNMIKNFSPQVSVFFVKSREKFNLLSD